MKTMVSPLRISLRSQIESTLKKMTSKSSFGMTGCVVLKVTWKMFLQVKDGTHSTKSVDDRSKPGLWSDFGKYRKLVDFSARLRPRGERTEDPSFPDCRQIKLDFSAFPAHFGTTCEPMISLAKLKSRNFQASFLSTFFPQIDGNSSEISAEKVHEGLTFPLSCSDWPDKETASPLDHFAKLFILGWPLR